MNSAEAGESGAAQDVGEDGFGLVIGGMRYGQPRQFLFVDEAREKTVARAASRIFDIGLFAFGFGGDVFSSNVKGQIILGSELGYEVLVGVGLLAAELVVEVDDA